jgi:methylmalonyl-CoA epimerase
MVRVVLLVLPEKRPWLRVRGITSFLGMTFIFSHDHVGITVTPEDLDTTIEWYSDNLGFNVDQKFESHGTTFVYLVAGDVKIELLAGASNPGTPVSNVLTSMDPQRLHHFCLAVQDLDAAVSQLRERGVRVIGGPMDIPEIGQRIAFVTDNVGTIIELTEPGTWPSGGRAHA